MAHEYVALDIRVPYRKLIRQFGGLPEDCAVCGKETPFWYERVDIPLCLECADCTPATEVPSKKQWLTKLGFVLPADWAPVVAE